MLTRALFVCTELDIAGLLAQSPMTIKQLAQATGSNTQALERLMYFLELHDIFIKLPDDRYINSEISKKFIADHPQSIHALLLHDDPTRWNCFGNIDITIKTGKPSFDQLYGTDYFTYTKKNPELLKRFDNAMTLLSKTESSAIAEKITFTGTVADIGGGNGQLLTDIKKQYPHIKTILFDLPEVVDRAQMSVDSSVGGSFFEPIGVHADIFVLKRVLHDWTDLQAIEILKNVTQGMSDSSILYIFEGILDQAADKKQLAAIDLLLRAIFGGGERTMREFSDIIKNAGLEIIKIETITDILSCIVCKKKTTLV